MEIEEVKGCIVNTLHSLIPPPLEPASPAPPPSPAPSPDLPQLLSFILSRLGPERAKSNSTQILCAAIKETVQKAFHHLQADLRLKGVSNTVRFVSSNESSCWFLYGRISSTPSSSHFLFVLQRFSQTLSVLLSAPLRVAAHPDSILSTIQELWKGLEQDFIQLVLGFQLDPDSEWSHCLATLGACLVVSEVNGVLGECSSGKQANLDGGGVSKVLDNLNQQFPAALYRKYQKWEQQEVGGASELVSTLQEGLILKVGYSEVINHVILFDAT